MTDRRKSLTILSGVAATARAAGARIHAATAAETAPHGAMKHGAGNGPMTTYEAGQSFVELPGDRYSVSANASETKPAKLLAAFVVDTNETELTIPLAN